MLCSYERELTSVFVKIFATKMLGQFAPESLGQFNWIVHYDFQIN